MRGEWDLQLHTSCRMSWHFTAMICLRNPPEQLRKRVFILHGTIIIAYGPELGDLSMAMMKLGQA